MSNPQSADHCFRVARACLERQQSAEAAQWLDRCLKLDPRHGAAWHLLGTVQSASGQEEAALSSQLRSCELHPQLGWNWFAAGELFERRGEWPKAHHHLRQAARWLAAEGWIAQRASLAGERALLSGESLEDGLGPRAYSYWCRHLEPSLPRPHQPLIHSWWGRGAGDRWLRLSNDGSCAVVSEGIAAEPWPAPEGWLLLQAPDSLLRGGALSALEKGLDSGDKPDLLYCDEDRLDEQCRRSDPWFKPDWVAESFWSTPWLEASSVWRIGWLREQGVQPPPVEAEGRWQWLLQVLEKNPRIRHVPRILVHRSGRIPVRTEAEDQRRADVLLHHLLRQGERVQAVRPSAHRPGGFELAWHLPEPLPRVRVVIPSRDRPALLEDCLNSLEATRRAIVPEIVVIDHASVEAATAETLRRWIRRLGSRLQVVRDEGAFNWSRLSNLGADRADTELLLFLNDDVMALDPGWLEAMAAQALRPAIGCVGAVLLYPDGGGLQHAGMVLGFGPPPGTPEHAYRGLPECHGVHRGRSRFLTGWPAVTGACLMVRRESFLAVGGFDEALPVEGNDVAFCLALTERGLRHVVEPSARLVHLECQSRDPLNSPTKAAALQWLRSHHPGPLETARPWWPAACSTLFTDGRPQELDNFVPN